MPSSSSARRRSESVRGLMPCSERSSSQNRERPSARSRTSSSVHLPQTMSAVRQTGQVASAMPLLYQLKHAARARFLAREQAAEAAAPAAAHGLHAPLGRLDED